MPPSTSNAEAVMLKAGSLQAHIVRRSGRLVAWRGAPESAILERSAANSERTHLRRSA
jgi:hypothetical protein